VLAFLEVTSAKETSFAMISALIANDTPRQTAWHLPGAIRNGATLEETRAVREIALRIATKAGVPLKHEVPNI
jgi:alkylhydroperoxidase/carboxymuconolactone decarboxylase family protein YurZ